MSALYLKRLDDDERWAGGALCQELNIGTHTFVLEYSRFKFPLPLSYPHMTGNPVVGMSMEWPDLGPGSVPSSPLLGPACVRPGPTATQDYPSPFL